MNVLLMHAARDSSSEACIVHLCIDLLEWVVHVGFDLAAEPLSVETVYRVPLQDLW